MRISIQGRPVLPFALTAMVVAMTFAPMTHAAAPAITGVLDASFGTADDGTDDGIVNTSLGQGDDFAYDVATQKDGKIVVIGDHVAKDGSHNLAVIRYNKDGSLDSKFGTSDDGTPAGIVSLSLGAGDDFGRGVAIQNDGKIVVAGYHVNNNTNNSDDSKDIFVARLNKDGTLDQKFSAGGDDTTASGVANLSLGSGDDVANDVAIDSKGRIVVTGQHFEGNSTNVIVARFNKDGSLDKKFGTAKDNTEEGVVNTSLGDGDDFATSLAIGKKDAIVVAGYHVNNNTDDSDSSTDAFVARYTAAGVLDASFSTGGTDTTPDGVANLSLGAGDDKANDVAIDSKGRIVIVGDHIEGDSSNVFLARYLGNGTLDASFGAGNDDNTPSGVVNTSLGDGDDFAKSLAIDNKGNLIVAGYHVNNNSDDNDSSTDIFVARYTTSGELDASFSPGSADTTPSGVANFSLGSGNDYGRAVVQADGKIVVAGDHVDTDNSSNITVLRLK